MDSVWELTKKKKTTLLALGSSMSLLCHQRHHGHLQRPAPTGPLVLIPGRTAVVFVIGASPPCHRVLTQEAPSLGVFWTPSSVTRLRDAARMVTSKNLRDRSTIPPSPVHLKWASLSAAGALRGEGTRASEQTQKKTQARRSWNLQGSGDAPRCALRCGHAAFLTPEGPPTTLADHWHTGTGGSTIARGLTAPSLLPPSKRDNGFSIGGTRPRPRHARPHLGTRILAEAAMVLAQRPRTGRCFMGPCDGEEEGGKRGNETETNDSETETERETEGKQNRLGLHQGHCPRAGVSGPSSAPSHASGEPTRTWRGHCPSTPIFTRADRGHEPKKKRKKSRKRRTTAEHHHGRKPSEDGLPRRAGPLSSQGSHAPRKREHKRGQSRRERSRLRCRTHEHTSRGCTS